MSVQTYFALIQEMKLAQARGAGEDELDALTERQLDAFDALSVRDKLRVQRSLRQQQQEPNDLVSNVASFAEYSVGGSRVEVVQVSPSRQRSLLSGQPLRTVDLMDVVRVRVDLSLPQSVDTPEFGLVPIELLVDNDRNDSDLWGAE